MNQHESPLSSVTPEQISFFHENGFLALDPITTPDELEWMRASYDRIFEERAGRDEGNQFDLGGTDEDGAEALLPQILNPAKYAPELKNGLYLQNAAAIAKQLLSPEATGGIGHAIYKPAGKGAATPWHQDEAYWDPELCYYSASFWLPLQEASLENGCLWFVPRSHYWEVLPHRSIGDDPRIHGLELAVPNVAEVTGDAVACPLKPGGVTVHFNRTCHYAGPNKTGGGRRALILGFGVPAKPYPVERRFPWNDIKIAPRQERAAKGGG